MRLLLAEDEVELSNAICAILKHDHFTVDAVYDGAEALERALTGNYDSVILDLMMPKKNGLEVLRDMRAAGVDSPVLILTAKSSLDDKIAGLDSGADDYLTKPFAMGELLARLRALTRRKDHIEPDVIEYGGLKLDRALYELCCGSECVHLGNKEFQIMELLMTSPGRLISTEQFMSRFWGDDAEAEINVVWVYISYLRRKLISIGAHVTIKAARGIGYSLDMSEAGDR